MDRVSPPVARKCCATDCMSTVAQTEFPEAEVANRSGAFHALGDEIRLKIVRLLAQHEALCVCEVQQAFEVGQPTISHHLKILRDTGLVDVQRKGTWAYYSLNRGALKDLLQEFVAVI
jgi:ArsR family transcriptional regulator